METPAVLTDFTAACQAAVDGGRDVPQAIAGLMRDLLADASGLAAVVPAFTPDDVSTSARGFRLGGEHVIHQAPDLTIMVLDTLPGVLQPPHDHAMNAFIGVFEGCEEQRFWTRTADGVEPTTGRMLEAGEMVALGERAIHAISAPVGHAARAVHVYLGDIYDVDRSVFDPDTMAEHPMNDHNYDGFCRRT